jgi:ergothioneine biosynthesis protein EgtB
MSIVAEHPFEKKFSTANIAQSYTKVRQYSLTICDALEPEDFICQPASFVSPPKWHLAHTTWFFEAFILSKYNASYKPFHPKFHYLFNSYYDTAGDHLLRDRRGTLSRPSTKIIKDYRTYVDAQMLKFIGAGVEQDIMKLIVLGLNHEQQHQELLIMDIKYILGYNPLFPEFHYEGLPASLKDLNSGKLQFASVLYNIGYSGSDFSYDNETPAHKVWIDAFEIEKTLVTNKEYGEFIEDGGYSRVDLWHSDGWEWLKQNSISQPLYWHKVDGVWCSYNFKGLSKLNETEPVMHVNFYEAAAFALWKGERLPTEYEWEIAAEKMPWGKLWEHTMSAYLPYPGYRKPEGAIGEYNAKFMVNQMVLRGSSFATPAGHERITYRNFFTPDMQWQFSGIRLARTL